MAYSELVSFTWDTCPEYIPDDGKHFHTEVEGENKFEEFETDAWDVDLWSGCNWVSCEQESLEYSRLVNSGLNWGSELERRILP